VEFKIFIRVQEEFVRNTFRKFFVLRVVQPTMYLKKILYCGLYNLLLWCSGGYHVSLTPKGLPFEKIKFNYRR